MVTLVGTHDMHTIYKIYRHLTYVAHKASCYTKFDAKNNWKKKV